MTLRLEIKFHQSIKFYPNRAHHQDLSDPQLDQLYDDAELRPEPEPTMQAPLPQITQAKIPEAPKILLQQVPQAP